MAAPAVGTALAAVDLALVTGHALARDLLEDGGYVAAHTRDAHVRPGQREVCRIVIEKDAAAPSALVVTAIAACSLPTVVHIVVAMTSIAALVEMLLVRVAAVAVRTADLFMPPAERETRAAVVLERGVFPFGRRVARLTRAPELSAVRIIALVTTMAGRRGARRGESVLVTLPAGAAGVPAQQRELGFAQVVELRRGPLPGWCVTRLAGDSKTPVVFVVPLMTRVTSACGWLVSLGLVATFTVRLAMQPFQRERGRIVIETHRPPGGLSMTVVAARPQASFMRVLARMAIAAV